MSEILKRKLHVFRKIPDLHGPSLDKSEVEKIAQFDLLARINISEHNKFGKIPIFSSLESHAVSVRQCDSTEFHYWANLITHGDPTLGFNSQRRWKSTFPTFYNRKLWEWAQILEVAKITGNLVSDKNALGFAVGQEPIPAILAKYGLKVLATDAPKEDSDAWIPTGEHMNSLNDLLHPEIVQNSIAAEKISVAPVDMNQIPVLSQKYDFIWSSCAIEHLGSPLRGFDFVLKTLDLLNEGGISCHTTELELEPRSETADYGNCAIYQVRDLLTLKDAVTTMGYEMELNTYVDLSTPQDRWISRIALVGAENTDDLSHLKLGIAGSISTSFVITIRKPYVS